MSDLITGTVEKFYALLASLLQVADNALNGLWNAVRESTDGSLKTINALTKEATNAGITVLECTVEKVDWLQKLPTTALESAQKCVNGILEETKETINTTINSVQNLASVISELTKELLLCGVRPLCLSKLLVKATETVATLTADVTKIISEVTGIIADAENGIGNCVESTLENAFDTVNSITSEVTTCISNKMAVKQLH